MEKIDQSVAHNGVCLTVVAVDPAAGCYRVTAVQETLERSNLGLLGEGSVVNLERNVTEISMLQSVRDNSHTETILLRITHRQAYAVHRHRSFLYRKVAFAHHFGRHRVFKCKIYTAIHRLATDTSCRTVHLGGESGV